MNRIHQRPLSPLHSYLFRTNCVSCMLPLGQANFTHLWKRRKFSLPQRFARPAGQSTGSFLYIACRKGPRDITPHRLMGHRLCFRHKALLLLVFFSFFLRCVRRLKHQFFFYLFFFRKCFDKPWLNVPPHKTCTFSSTFIDGHATASIRELVLERAIGCQQRERRGAPRRRRETEVRSGTMFVLCFACKLVSLWMLRKRNWSAFGADVCLLCLTRKSGLLLNTTN